MSRILLAWFLLFLSTAVAAPQSTSPAQSSSGKPWAKYCHLNGITFPDREERDFLAKFSRRCNAADACLLSCIRSGCAKGVGGGCFHMCSSGANGDADMLQRALEYEDRTAYLCRSPPNRSFKPNPPRDATAPDNSALNSPLDTTRGGSA
jgi:hypothetical protein